MADKHTMTPQETSEQVARTERLFAEHHDYIRATIGHFISDSDEGDDVYQDLFVYFVRKPISPDIVNLEAYLYRVILDRVRDRKRSQTRYCRHVETYARQVTQKKEQPVEVTIPNAQAQELFDLLDVHLKKNEAAAILHCYKDDLEIAEAARKMNIHPRSLSRYLCVGLKKIRKIVCKDAD